jgi:hypothetical protein
VDERSTESIQQPAQRVCITEAVRNYCLCLMQPAICLILSETDQVSYSMFILRTLVSLETSKESQALTFPIFIQPVFCSNFGRATDHCDLRFQGKFWDKNLNRPRLLPFTSFPIHYSLSRKRCYVYRVRYTCTL